MLRSHVLSGRHSLYLFPIMERLADPLLAILVLLSWAKIVFSFLMVSGIEEGVRRGQLDLSLRGIDPDPMPVQLLANQGVALSAP